MELYLDSANLKEIEEGFKLGFLNGLTTTPTFMQKEGITDMNHTLTIQLSGCEGAVIRALGLIERRGFSLDKCKVGEVENSSRSMEVSVSSSRPGELLKRQLERLHDVLNVELKPATAIKRRTPGIRPVTRSI